MATRTQENAFPLATYWRLISRWACRIKPPGLYYSSSEAILLKLLTFKAIVAIILSSEVNNLQWLTVFLPRFFTTTGWQPALSWLLRLAALEAMQ
jgi:hypothetical protein